MSIYDDAKINLIPITENTEDGGQTRGAIVSYSAQVQDHNKIIISNGENIQTEYLIWVNAPAKLGDLIIVTERFGILTNNTHEFKVKKIIDPLGFSKSCQVELYI